VAGTRARGERAAAPPRSGAASLRARGRRADRGPRGLAGPDGRRCRSPGRHALQRLERGAHAGGGVGDPFRPLPARQLDLRGRDHRRPRARHFRLRPRLGAGCPEELGHSARHRGARSRAPRPLDHAPRDDRVHGGRPRARPPFPRRDRAPRQPVLRVRGLRRRDVRPRPARHRPRPVRSDGLGVILGLGVQTSPAGVDDGGAPARQPRACRGDGGSQPRGGAAPPRAEDGGDRSPGGGRGARLQQPAHGDRRERPGSVRPPLPTGDRPARRGNRRASLGSFSPSRAGRSSSRR